MIRASVPYTSGWGSFVLLKMDCVRVARGGSLSTLHRASSVSGKVSVRLDLIGIHCDAPLTLENQFHPPPPPHFQASQCIPMRSNLTLTLMLSLPLRLEARCVYTLRDAH